MRLTSPDFSNATLAELLQAMWADALGPVEAYGTAAGFDVEFSTERGAEGDAAPCCDGLVVKVTGVLPPFPFPSRLLHVLQPDISSQLVCQSNCTESCSGSRHNLLVQESEVCPQFEALRMHFRRAVAPVLPTVTW